MASPPAYPTEEHACLVAHEGPVLCVRFSRTGAYLLTCGRDRTFRLWNPYKATLIKTYAGHAHEVRDVSCASDNSRLATCGGDKQVFVWDVATGAKLRRFRGHEGGGVNAVAFAADHDQVVVSAGYDRRVNLYDARANTPDPAQSLLAHADSVSSVAVADHRVVSGGVDGVVCTWDVRAGIRHRDVIHRPVGRVSFSGDAGCVLAGVVESRLALLDASSGEVLAEYRGHAHERSAIASTLSSDDALVASGSEDGRVVMWELVDADVVASIDAHPKHSACGLDWHPRGDVMATGGTDGLAKVWVPPGGRGRRAQLE